MESINKFLSIEDQIKNLENKGLKFIDEESRNMFILYLEDYNYEILINGYWFEDLYQEDKKTFSEMIYSDDIRYLFDIDRTISSIIWKYFKGIELHLNALITHILCKAFEKYLDGPYVVLINEKSVKQIFGNYTPKKIVRKYKNEDSNNIKKYLLKYASRNKWFEYVTRYNREFENKEIIRKVDDSVSNLKEWSTIKKYSLVHLQTLSSSWTFSELIWIYKSLSDDLQDSLREKFFDYGNIYKDNNFEIESVALIELLEKFSLFRNALAHNSKIIDWKIKIETEELANTFSSIIGEEVFINKPYNISFIVKIIQGIRRIENDKILKEIEDYIFEKNENSNKKISKVTKDIIKKNVNIEMK